MHHSAAPERRKGRPKEEKKNSFSKEEKGYLECGEGRR
jgi:hypothetical protein